MKAQDVEEMEVQLLLDLHGNRFIENGRVHRNA
jgi:hypothetical protein